MKDEMTDKDFTADSLSPAVSLSLLLPSFDPVVLFF